MHRSASFTSAAAPTHHGAERETDSNAGAKSSEIANLKAESIKRDGANNDDNYETGLDNAVHDVVDLKNFDLTNYYNFAIKAYARQFHSKM